MITLTCFGFLPILSFDKFFICENCKYGKQTRSSPSPINRTQVEPLELVHSDVCGPMLCKSLRRANSFIKLIDDVTQKIWVYPLKARIKKNFIVPKFFHIC